MPNLFNLLRNRENTSTEKPHGAGGRQAILHALLKNRAGLTADDLAQRLSVTRSAVHQHLSGLERDGFAERRTMTKTKGRPGQVYAITETGIHQFPKQYDLFSSLLLSALATRHSGDDLRGQFQDLGAQIGAQLRAGTGEHDDPIEALVTAMNDLGYVAHEHKGGEDGANIDGREVQAFNCVYHHLAKEHPEICEFDISLMETLIGRRPEHVECMVRGGQSCRFQFPDKTASTG